ncbi:MAG: tRNA dihydrouridine synthase DusB [Spirochaetia bacterium]|jgi:nifR3 family TIM-barrel protein|nr:tRNA dihydrouridine synthase DusB [Spirochaetia bacterium]
MSTKKMPPFLLDEKKWSAPYFLAPVAGYSDVAFRAICAEMGAALCYTEMVSAEALVRNHAKTKELLARDPAETHYAIQLFGANPATLAKAAEIVSAFQPSVIDLNCGCPVPKIIKAGTGSALLKTPERIGEIVRAMRNATSVPISVKIRTGWDEKSINYLETAGMAIEAGACAITLHGRTRAQGYSGKAEWDAIKALAAQTSVPIFGSGDVFSADDAIAMQEYTGCDGVMIARGAIGNPFIFQELCQRAAGQRIDEALSPKVVSQTALHHLELAVKYLGEQTACIEFRKHFCAYTKGFVGGAALRAQAVRCSTFVEFQRLLELFAESAA